MEKEKDKDEVIFIGEVEKEVDETFVNVASDVDYDETRDKWAGFYDGLDDATDFAFLDPDYNRKKGKAIVKVFGVNKEIKLRKISYKLYYKLSYVNETRSFGSVWRITMALYYKKSLCGELDLYFKPQEESSEDYLSSIGSDYDFYKLQLMSRLEVAYQIRDFFDTHMDEFDMVSTISFGNIGGTGSFLWWLLSDEYYKKRFTGFHTDLKPTLDSYTYDVRVWGCKTEDLLTYASLFLREIDWNECNKATYQVYLMYKLHHCPYFPQMSMDDVERIYNNWHGNRGYLANINIDGVIN